MLMAAMGQAAGPMVLHFTYGYEVMAVSVVALVAGLLLAPIPPVLLVLGAVVAAVAWGVGTSTSTRSNVHRAQH
jgi:Na+/H+-translocating membrane pyrophosphatase